MMPRLLASHRSKSFSRNRNSVLVVRRNVSHPSEVANVTFHFPKTRRKFCVVLEA